MKNFVSDLWLRVQTRVQHVPPALLFAAVLGIAACKVDARKPNIGSSAPEYSAMDIDGQPVTLASLKGKVVVLNEWATWCEPCRIELPQLEALHQQFAAQGLVVIGVSVDAFGTANDVRDFTRDHGMTYPIWLDPDKRIATRFLTFGVPETIVIDRNGVIRHRQIGAIPQGDTTITSVVRWALGS